MSFKGKANVEKIMKVSNFSISPELNEKMKNELIEIIKNARVLEVTFRREDVEVDTLSGKATFIPTYSVLEIRYVPEANKPTRFDAKDVKKDRKVIGRLLRGRKRNG